MYHPHGDKSQKEGIFTLAGLRTSNLAVHLLKVPFHSPLPGRIF
jgi:hypothetical protein